MDIWHARCSSYVIYILSLLPKMPFQLVAKLKMDIFIALNLPQGWEESDSLHSKLRFQFWLFFKKLNVSYCSLHPADGRQFVGLTRLSYLACAHPSWSKRKSKICCISVHADWLPGFHPGAHYRGSPHCLPRK